MTYTRESVALAWRTLRETDEGRLAVSEKWGLAVWEWIADSGCEPTAEEWAVLRREARRLREQRAKLPAQAQAVLERREQRIAEGVYGRG
jgi:hypothetical protein